MLTTHAGALMPHLPAPDPSFANVVLLLHFDNSDESPYPDFSSYHRATTAVGLLATDTVDPLFGAGSGIYDGTNYISCDSSIDFGFDGDWTIECFVKRTGVSAVADLNLIFANVLAGGGTQLRAIYYNAASGVFGYRGPTAVSITAASAWPLNTWVHLAATRASGTVRFFQDGILQGTLADISPAVAHAITVGGANASDWGANHGFVGELDEFRITKGLARYTADFTPPTAPFPDE